MSDSQGGPDQAALADVGYLSIQQVSELLDVPAPTIRSWERRYGLPQATRTRAGHRRYSPGHVQALRRMRDAIARGQGAAEAATLARTAEMRAEGAQPLIDALLTAARNLDPRTINDTLDGGHSKFGLDATIDDVLMPALRQIGLDWQSGRCDVAHEHLASETIRVWLAKIARDGPTDRRNKPPIILTCGPQDHHTVGLEALSALLRRRGEDCRLLGASVPIESLSAAVTQVRPAAVVLVSHLSVGRRAAVEALDAAAAALRAADLHPARLFYAGNAFLTQRARRGVTGSYLGGDLSQAADLITTTVNGADEE